MIAESNEWAKIVKPSLRDLGTDLRALNGKFVQAQLVPTGRGWVNQQGEKKENTTFKFLAVYDDFETCAKAADAFFNGRRKLHSSSSGGERWIHQLQRARYGAQVPARSVDGVREGCHQVCREAGREQTHIPVLRDRLARSARDHLRLAPLGAPARGEPLRSLEDG